MILLASGILQEADHWSLYSTQVSTHIGLVVAGGILGILAAGYGLWATGYTPLRGVLVTVAGFLAAGTTTAVSIPMAWGYLLEFSSNIAFIVVLVFSLVYVTLYLTVAAITLVSRGNGSSPGTAAR